MFLVFLNYLNWNFVVVTAVTRVVEEGDSVSGGGACGRDQQLGAVVGGGATEEAGLRDHAPHFTGLDVA